MVAARTAANRSFREQLQEHVDSLLGEMLQSFRDAWLAGDWRAAQALLHEAYGLPLQRVEAERNISIVVQSVVPEEELEAEAVEVEAEAGEAAA